MTKGREGGGGGSGSFGSERNDKRVGEGKGREERVRELEFGK